MRKTILLILLSFYCCHALAQQYHFGDLYTAPDGSKGIVYHIFPDGKSGLAVALHDASTSSTWGTSIDIPGLTNHPENVSYQSLICDTAGYANTLAIRTNMNNNTSAAGTVDFINGWVLPSSAQLNILCGLYHILNEYISNFGGTPISSAKYWSSSESNSARAWYINFSTGEWVCEYKSSRCRVRAVHYFRDDTNPYDTTLTYLWNTGSDQPYISASPSATSSYAVTATNSSGCSATANQIIVVGNGTIQTITDQVCQGTPYENHGFIISAEETSSLGNISRVRTIETTDCGASLALQLTVKPKFTFDIYENVCDQYEWNGITYYEDGEYIQNFDAQNGCDSIVTLHLAVRHGTHHSETVSACDSLIHYILTVCHKSVTHEEMTTCRENLPVAWNGESLTREGEYSVTLQNHCGNDSIVYIQLTIKDLTVSIIPMTDDFCEDYNMILSVESEATDYVWNTGETVSTIIVTEPGLYTVTAMQDNCRATAEFSVQKCDFTLYLPNTITPGKLDGTNDCFSLPEFAQRQIGDFEITIFNRWGEVVYYSKDKSFKWYGDYKGFIYRNNVYNYLIYYTEAGTLRKKKQLKGCIIVL